MELEASIDVLVKTASKGGKAVWCGIGKAGHIARYASSLMASAAMQSAFLHPAEAMHGDFGVLGANDCLLVLSHSGASQEPLAVIEHAKWLRRVPIIAITSHPESAIAVNADYLIAYTSEPEAIGKVPANASLEQLRVCNELVIGTSVKLKRGLEYLRDRHPGGAIGSSYKEAK